jgi:hypothetical protein
MPRPKSDKEGDRVRRMVHQHLQGRASLASAAPLGVHLDEDALSAFIEGRLGNLESAPLIRHLIGCGSCRNITAQLIRLDTELSGFEAEAAPSPAEEPGRIRRLLADLASRVLPSSDDDVVFAYHAPADDFEKMDKAREGVRKPDEVDKPAPEEK